MRDENAATLLDAAVSTQTLLSGDWTTSRIGRIALALMLVIGCAPPQGDGNGNNARPDRNVITLPKFSMQYDGDIVVYLNNARLGGPEALRQVQASRITSIRYHDPGAANFKFGSGHHRGAIQVSTELAVERPTS